MSIFCGYRKIPVSIFGNSFPKIYVRSSKVLSEGLFVPIFGYAQKGNNHDIGQANCP